MKLLKTAAIFFIALIAIAPLNAQEDGDNITFGKYRILKSKILDQDRLLYVHLPIGYEESDESYPVVFQLYGHFMENYYLPAIRTATLMGELGKSPKMIVVGIMNREFRYRDLLPVDYWGGESEIEKFIEFFNDELIPFVEKEYRVQEYRILSGPQAGAAFGIYTFAKYPGMFNAWILSSPFWIDAAREPLLEMLEEGLLRNEYSKKMMMVSYGRQESEEELNCINKLGDLMMQAQGYKFRYYANKYPGDFGFSTPVGIEKGLKLLFDQYPFPVNTDLHKLSDIEKHFKEQSEYYGFKITPPELGLVKEGDKNMAQGEIDAAIEIFKKMNELYPDGLMGYDRLGGAYQKKGDIEQARMWYEGFLKRQPENPRVKKILEDLK